MKYLMSNLKSNKTLNELLEYKKDLKKINFNDIEFVLFPSSLYLSFFYDVSYKIGSQNLSVYEEEEVTGEILAKQLKSLKVSYTLLNHAEVKDTKEDVIKKIKVATKEKIKVVLCLGENKKENNVLEEVIIKLEDIFSYLTLEEQQNCIIAYEPLWAIHSGVTAEPDRINKVASQIKQYLLKKYNLKIPILYGGSIQPNNFEKLTNLDNIDGFLIGNCSNNPENIKEILEKI